MKLLNFATVLLIWLMGVQYLINNFIAPWVVEHLIKKGKNPDEAILRKENFKRICQWIILGLLIFTIIIATRGYLISLKEN